MRLPGIGSYLVVFEFTVVFYMHVFVTCGEPHSSSKRHAVGLGCRNINKNHVTTQLGWMWLDVVCGWLGCCYCSCLCSCWCWDQIESCTKKHCYCTAIWLGHMPQSNTISPSIFYVCGVWFSWERVRQVGGSGRCTVSLTFLVVNNVPYLPSTSATHPSEALSLTVEHQQAWSNAFCMLMLDVLWARQCTINRFLLGRGSLIPFSGPQLQYANRS